MKRRTFLKSALAGATALAAPHIVRAEKGTTITFVPHADLASLDPVWTTADGRSWKTIVLPVPNGAATAVLQQVAINGNHVVALGQATTAAGTGAGTAVGPAAGPGAGTAASTVPFAEFSATVPPESVALVGASLTSVTLMVNALSTVSPPWSVTRTVMPCEVALS